MDCGDLTYEELLDLHLSGVIGKPPELHHSVILEVSSKSSSHPTSTLGLGVGSDVTGVIQSILLQIEMIFIFLNTIEP